MINTKQVMIDIASAYDQHPPYDVLIQRHAKIISDLLDEWEKVSDRVPKDKQRVFAIQDLSAVGRGKFVGTYYYRENIGFVAYPYADDAYGFITHWCPTGEQDEYEVIAREFVDDDDRKFEVSHGKYDTESGDTWIFGIDSEEESISITIKDLDRLIDALQELKQLET